MSIYIRSFKTNKYYASNYVKINNHKSAYKFININKI